VGRLREWYSQRRLRLGYGSLDCSGDRESWKQPDDTLLLYRCARKQATSNIVHKVVVFSDSYQPYGQDNRTPTGSNTYKFTGKPVSQTTGLYYYGARWYDQSIGRFISVDKGSGSFGNPQSLNSYVYACGNPTTYVDPDGNEPTLFTQLASVLSGYFWTLRYFRYFYDLNRPIPGAIRGWGLRTDIYHFRYENRYRIPLKEPGHTIAEAIDKSHDWYVKLDAPSAEDPFYQGGQIIAGWF